MTIRGFDPIAGPDARVLVLGTIPSVASLELQQYYGNTRNAFWTIMQELFGSAGEPATDYAARVEQLLGHRVAVWDVLHSARRAGSLDADIEPGSEVANDIGGFVGAHPELRAVFFNGAKAEALFRRHVAAASPPGSPLRNVAAKAPAADSAQPSALRFRRLPSTSPANAALTAAEKLEAWRAVADAASG